MIKFPKINLNKKKVIYSFIILFLILGTFPFIFYSILNHNYQSKIFDKTNDVPETYAALVLGAGVYKNGEPSPILQDRLNAAVDLYNSGKVTKLIVSGDNRFTHYDEPTVMKDFLVK